MSAPINYARRTLLQAGALMTLGAPAFAAAADPWQRAKQIADKLARPPRFRKEDFPITRYGAKTCELKEITVSTHGHTQQQKTPVAGSPDSRPAILAAIAACSKAGGGRVLIPAGSWYCGGPIVLRSNVNLHLAAGAQLYFSPDPRDYARDGDVDCGKNGKLVLSRWQGNDVLNYSPLIYAHKETNIALTGEDWTSILDGQAGVRPADGSESWWDWTVKNKPALPSAGLPNPLNPPLADVAPHLSAAERALIEQSRGSWQGDSRYLPALSEAGVPVGRRVFGLGHYLRPCMVEFIDCTDVLMQGYQLTGSPFWLHHPVACRNVRIHKVRMDSMGPNNDGFDPESCDTVLVDDCLFNTGDDCIAIKSGKNRDIKEGPTRNVVVQDCVMNCGHGGVTLGSEMAAGIEHVYAQRIEFRNIHWDVDPLGSALRLKTNMNRGGFLRHFYARDLTVPNGVKTTPGFYRPPPGSTVPPNAASPGGGAIITFDCDYAAGDDGVRTRPPSVSDVHISNIKAGDVKTKDGSFSCFQAILILGPVAASFNGKPGTPILPVTNVTITDCDFGTPRSTEHPWFVHNARGVKLRNVRAGGKTVNQTLSA
jgi:polygalacturonase